MPKFPKVKKNAPTQKVSKAATKQENPKSKEANFVDEQILRRIYVDMAGIMPNREQLARWITDPRDRNVKTAELTARLAQKNP